MADYDYGCPRTRNLKPETEAEPYVGTLELQTEWVSETEAGTRTGDVGTRTSTRKAETETETTTKMTTK